LLKDITEQSTAKGGLFLEEIKNVKFAELSELGLNKLRETEQFLNSRPDANSGEEVILLAFKKKETH
jgi:hypothetical protein